MKHRQSKGVGRTEAMIRVLRPKQWAKNIFVFAGLIFAIKLLDVTDVMYTGIAFVVFCTAASAGYVFNDILDRESDRLHPTKRERPIAAGYLSLSAAYVIVVCLTIFSVAVSWIIRPQFGILIIAFMLTSFIYTVWLKHIVIIDIMVIAALFVFRAAGGAIAIDVPISAWLLICSTLLALFLILGKRYHELNTYGEAAYEYRKVIKDYSKPFIREMLTISTATTLIGYSLYAFYSQTANGSSQLLMITIPFVFYGLFRYLYLVYEKDQGGSPEQILFSDMPILVNLILWVIVSVAILYFL